MFLASNELDLRKVTEWSAKSWQLSAVARRRRKTVVRVFFIPSPMTGHIMRPLLNWLCEQCPYLSSNCLCSLLSLFPPFTMDLEEEVSGSCCNLHKATHFLISSTTFIPSSSTSVNIATLQVLPKNKTKFNSVLIANSLLSV